MAKGVADKNMNEIEAAQKIIELAQEKQKKATHELETVHKEKWKITNELEEKVVKKAKSKWKVSLSSMSEVSNFKYLKWSIWSEVSSHYCANIYWLFFI